MGNENSKLNYRKAVIQLTTKTEPVDSNNDEFWDQFWNEYETTIQDIFILIPAAEIRALREESPTNLSILCSKAIKKVLHLSESSFLTTEEQHTILNCVRMLTRIIPYIFEDAEWNSFFWFPFNQQNETNEDQDKTPVAEHLMTCISNLLFYPDFTVSSIKKSGPENPEGAQFINSCEYIWENGVGFSASLGSTSSQDAHRTELLKLLLTCFSITMYMRPEQGHNQPNPWITFFTSRSNKHCLPLFTSILNVVFSYDPVGYGMPYNHLMFSDYREPLVEVAIQILCITLESNSESSNSLNQVNVPDDIDKSKNENNSKDDEQTAEENNSKDDEQTAEENNSEEENKSVTDVYNNHFEGPENFFINFMSRIHKENDFDFILRGFSRLLNNPLSHTYLPNSMKKIQFHQELLILFWRICEINKNFMFHVLKGDHLMEILVPILYHLNDARRDPARLGVMHIGVFILLLLSGERNFGVKLNKLYQNRVNIDVPVFTGTHADLLVLVFHKIITTGHTRLQPLYDCFLTVIVNVSPYLKSLSMVAATKILHLIEAFSSPWFLFSSPTNHHLIFFLLEVLNNIIQYQFDGNSNIIYSMIRKRQIFHDLSSLKSDSTSISQALSKKSKRAAKIAVMLPAPVSANSPSGSFYTPQTPSSPISQRSASVESSSQINSDIETGQLKASLEITPSLQFTIDKSRTNSGRTLSTSTSDDNFNSKLQQSLGDEWLPTSEWVQSWKQKLPLQTIMRLLQVLVPQVEKICIDKGLTDESEIIKFLQRGTLVGLLPVPHPILIRKYQSNPGTDKWFRTYMWGVIYLRNIDPPIWYDTNIQLFEIQRVTGSN